MVPLSSSSRRGSIFAITELTEEAGVLVPNHPHNSREASVLLIEEVSLQVNRGLLRRYFNLIPILYKCTLTAYAKNSVAFANLGILQQAN
jgi:hypothetical protein